MVLRVSRPSALWLYPSKSDLADVAVRCQLSMLMCGCVAVK